VILRVRGDGTVQVPLRARVSCLRTEETSEPSGFGGFFVLGLVIPVRIERQLAEQFAVVALMIVDVEVLDDHQDGVRAWVRPMQMWCSFPFWRMAREKSTGNRVCGRGCIVAADGPLSCWATADSMTAWQSRSP
jgi:hypothetical protein